MKTTRTPRTEDTVGPTRPRRFEATAPDRAPERSDDANAFIPDPGKGPPRVPDELAESLGEEFVEAATTGEDPDEEVLDATFSEEIGGPFIETTESEELGRSIDDANPSDAESEPLPRAVAGLAVDPEIDERLDAERLAREGGAADDGGVEADADDEGAGGPAARAEPPDPAGSVGALNDDATGRRAPT